MARLPSPAALLATYCGTCPRAEQLLERARSYRDEGDHAAAGVLERDAAAEQRMAHLRRAFEWDAARTGPDSQ